jgi:deoxyribonuclease-4
VPIGAHVGVGDGYAAAVGYAVSVGGECIQVFAKSPRRWEAKPLAADVAESFRSACQRAGFTSVLTHTAYLINLGSADDALWVRSYHALADELRRAELLGASAVVTHVGTHYEGSPEPAARRIATAVDRAWSLADVHGPRLLLENTAGAGTTFGDGPDELGAVIALLDAAAPFVGVCLDTCHAHAAGWDLSAASGWREVLERCGAACGSTIEAIHANDCMFPAGSHRDRHAWIGEGTIGYQGFAAMFEQQGLASVPIIIEMPGEMPLKDAENISRLKRLRDASVARGRYVG